MLSTLWRRLLGRSQLDPLGERGENVAAKHLRSIGYTILHRNFRCRQGEVDIIARDGKTLVFVEVKTRKDGLIDPETAVNVDKQKTISRVAEVYLSRFGSSMPPARFDVVAVIWPRNQKPIIRHTPDAFESTD